MIGRVNSFGKNGVRVVCCLVVMAFLAVANTGCDIFDSDDDNSAGGSVSSPVTVGTTTTGSGETATSTTAQSITALSGTGFVWKPVSDNTGNLAVLLPSSYSNVGVSVLSPDGNLIENGNYVGRSNGDRPTYRFSRPGGSFPDGSLLKIGSRQYVVPDTSQRYD